jgi:hypothetical protein
MSSKQWHGGKGSQRRGDDSKSNEQYRSNWDRIFGGIDYGDKDLAKQYHSESLGIDLQPGKNFSDKKPDPLSTKQINNGENK